MIRPAHGSSEIYISLIMSDIYIRFFLFEIKLFFPTLSANRKFSVGVLFAFCTLSELSFSTEWTEEVGFPQVFSAELTLGVFYTFFDEAFMREYFFLEEVDNRKGGSYSEEYEEIVPKHEDLEVLQELHDSLKESFWDNLEHPFTYFPEYREKYDNEEVGRNERLGSIFSCDRTTIPEPNEKEKRYEEEQFYSESLEWVGELQTRKRSSEALCSLRSQESEDRLKIAVLLDKHEVCSLLGTKLFEFLGAFLYILSDSLGTRLADRLTCWLVCDLFKQNRIVPTFEAIYLRLY